MWNEIEKRSVQAITGVHGVDSREDVAAKAYQNKGKGEVTVLEDVSLQGETILAVEKEGELWYLQSRYDAEKAAAEWSEQVKENISSSSVIIVFGFGDGSYIRKLLSYNKTSHILVYEPCAEIFWKVFGREEVVELLEVERVHLVVEGICDNWFFAYLEALINYSNYRLIETLVLPNYNQLFTSSYRYILKKQLYAVKSIIFSRNTEMYFGKEFLHNMLHLAKDVIEQYSVVQLTNIISEKDMEGLPAVLVAAGPSLDKNIEQLKAVQEYVFILAVDTALNTVLSHGIIPDMTITVDSHKPLELFADERVKDIPVALAACSNEKVVAQSRAKHFYELDPKEYLSILYGKIEKEVAGLATGGSVANNALSLLVLMGFQTIIFMGQDLAYPNGQQHTFAAYQKKEELEEGRPYFEIEDIYGNRVLTEENMEIYLRWFESYIDFVTGVRFIDATEGGAKIRGTEICTMAELKEELMSHSFDKSIIFEGLAPYLTVGEQQQIKQMIIKLPEQLGKAERRIKEGLRLYEKIDQINRKSRGRASSLSKMLRQLTELNTYMDEEPALAIVKYYTIEVGYQVSGQVLVYDEMADMYEQIKGVIENGRMLLEGYLTGIGEFRKDMDQFLKDFLA